jgi:hypothetical protein
MCDDDHEDDDDDDDDGGGERCRKLRVAGTFLLGDRKAMKPNNQHTLHLSALTGMEKKVQLLKVLLLHYLQANIFGRSS